MRNTLKVAKVMMLVMCLVQPLGAQTDPGPSPGVGPPLDSEILDLAKGRWIRIDTQASGRLEGELLAVDEQSLWMLSNGVPQNVPFGGLPEIQVRRHGFGTKQVWTWIGIGAAVTGLGLTAACSSYDGSGECGGIFFGMALSWGIIGGLFSLDVVGSAWDEVPPISRGLVRYARFPQGLPPGYGR